MGQVIRRNDLNSLIDSLNTALKYSRGINAIKNNPKPDPGGAGPGLSWHCTNYGGGGPRNVIPENQRSMKYQGDNAISYRFNAGDRTSAEKINRVINTLNTAIDQIKSNVTGGSGPGLTVNKVSSVQQNTIVRLEQLRAISNAISTINNTLSRVNGWYNSNNRCNLSCQVNCQVNCQVACNSVSWCHDQKCGGH